MDLETLQTALTMFHENSDFAWLTIVESTGSSPRHAGTSMLVRPDGGISGTIGGGPLEAAAIESALDAIQARESRMMEFDLTNEVSASLGMICGGRGTVLVDFISAQDPRARDYFSAAHDLLEAGGKGWTVLTVPVESSAGWTARRALVRGDWTTAGDLACSHEELRDALKPSGARTGDLAGPGSLTYILPTGRQGAAYVFGAGHCGEKVIPLLGSAGFYTVVVDDRDEFANSHRFPSADRIVVPDSFDDVVQRLPIDEDSYLIIVTRGHLQDRTVLQQALATDAAYIGMIGSKKKVAGIFQALEKDGVPPQSIARVHAPIGLEIGAETPEEIAISIAAELVQVRASRRS